MNLMATRRYDGSAGVFVVGADDPEYKGYAAQLVAAARAAGMDVQYLEVPGGHSYQTWSEGLRREIGWLGTRTGITA